MGVAIVRLKPAPTLRLAGLPEKERHATHLLGGSVSDLASYVNDYSQAFALFLESRQAVDELREKSIRTPLSDQEMDIFKGLLTRCAIAHRDSIMTVYHFGVCLEGINKTLGSCPAARAALDQSALKAARKLYRERFPRAEATRHAVGHRGDLTKTPSKHAEHSFDGVSPIPGFVGKFEGLTIKDAISDGGYTNTWEKEVRTAALDQASVQALIDIYEHVVRAFTPVEAALRSLPQASPTRG